MIPPEPISSQDRKGGVFVLLFLLFLFSALIVQFYKIQIIEEEQWKAKALRQHQIAVVEPARRGLFYSNTSIKAGHPEHLIPFVVDVARFHLFADPQVIGKELHKEIASSLVHLMKLRQEEGVKIEETLSKKSRSRKLQRWLSPEEKEKIQAWWNLYAKKRKLPKNALFFVQDYKRSYPYGKLLGQVLHTLQEERDPISQQNIPTGGLELSLNQYLAGKDGKRLILKSPRHPLDTGILIKPAENGADVYLSINHTLQAIVEEEMLKAVKSANAKSGWAILVEPKTGEILALAQAPSFDLSFPKTYFNNRLLQDHTRLKALTDPFEPGSIMKPLTLAVAFAANEELERRGKLPLFFPEEKIPALSGAFPGRKKPITDLSPRKFLNMELALQKSSNIYVGRLIQRAIEQLGEEWYKNTLQNLFGFGKKTNIELLGESAGMLPAPGKKYPSGATQWSKATPFSLAMGYNLLATSLQTVRAFAILANRGCDVNLTLIRKIVKKNQDGTLHVILDHTSKQNSPRRVISKEHAEQIVNAMRYVTKPGGTAKRAKILGYTVAGKTGTSEKIVNGAYAKKINISTFIGFAPVTDPKFVLITVIDEPEYKYIPGVGKMHMGGACCATVFADIGRRVLEYLGVPLDDPDNKNWEDKIKQLQQLDKAWNQ